MKINLAVPLPMCSTFCTVECQVGTSGCCPNALADNLGNVDDLDWHAMALRCCNSTYKFQIHGPTILVGPTACRFALVFIFFARPRIVLVCVEAETS